MVDQQRGASIRIFLIDGTPQGMRLVERIGWTGCCLSFSRSDYDRARHRAELQRSGVYVLVGADPQGARPVRIYIGEGEEVRIRLDAHVREKDFWSSAFVLTTKDDSLNKAHIRYLEARLIAMAQTAQIAGVENATNPAALGRLSEPETSDMEAYLDEALILLPLLGVTAFEIYDEPAASTAAQVTKNDQARIAGQRYRLTTQLTEAEGYSDSRGFAVLAGALARKETKVMVAGYQRIREELVAEGILVSVNDRQYRLARTFIFDSPSSAASVLAGGSKNGRTEWKDDQGRTIKENEEATAASPA
ncbi:GIY-YIG nuclease family protein [Streptomyces sp. YPW6]|uniref:GIY-YIG nuclease family protein n=1 Tax=Streptomyces sp. YPW6 TaxID=2840373 RepID=UPI001C0E39B7|nr:GIY-YIG nuclease family protein [Streptomyces sp. YPW6]QWQ39621.1 GIY-YIG nuclease family protein [Streptomyces sp. YPW6]